MNNKKIAVIGRGVIGLSTGLHLKECGFDVTLFGPATLENIASTAAVGIVSTKGITLANTPFFKDKMVGNRSFANFLKKIERYSKYPIKSHFNGVHEIAQTLEDYQILKERVYHGNFTGCTLFEFHRFNQGRSKSFVPHQYLKTKGSPFGNFHYPFDLWVDPVSFIESLEKALDNMGIPKIPFLVDSISLDNKTFRVLTKKENFVFDEVVLACGHNTPDVLKKHFDIEFLPFLTVPGLTMRGHFDNENITFSFGRRALSIHQNKLRYGSIDFSKNSHPSLACKKERFHLLKTEANEKFGHGSLNNLDSLFGIRLALKDRKPLIGPLQLTHAHKIWLNCGFHKNAYSFCEAAGKEIARLLLLKDPQSQAQITQYSPLRFQHRSNSNSTK